MAQEEKRNLIPQVLYANAYIETWTDILGKNMKNSDLVNYVKIKKIYQTIMKLTVL